jgi:hypothetical protein
MITIKLAYNGTRLRRNHTTFADVIDTYDVNAIVEGDLIWTAPLTGNEVKMGDKWLHVTKINGVIVDGWMAIIHLGKTFATIEEETTPPLPPPTGDGVKRIIKVVTHYETDAGEIKIVETFPVVQA